MHFSNQDSASYNAFRDLTGQSGAYPADSTQLEVIEWDQSDSSAIVDSLHITVSELGRRKQPSVRIIFAPLDYPNPRTLNVLLELFRLYSFPSHYLHERVQSVTHSLGFENLPGGGYTSWFHFLCKSINPEHDSTFWIKSGYFLKCDHQSTVTMICFGASSSLKHRFRAIPRQAWRGMLSDPYSLFAVILSDLHLQMDSQVWAVAEPIRELENYTTHADADAYQPNFIDLHNIAKNVVHLREASDAILRTITHMVQRCRSLDANTSASQPDGTVAALGYHETLFESVNLRVISLEKRMQNMINLSFNLVAQKNSNAALDESSSMHTIALTTLIFLPLSTVATIFGSQFFNFNASTSPTGVITQSFDISSSFWIFWVVSVPLTLFVFALWLYMHRCPLSHWVRLRRPKKTAHDRVKDVVELRGLEVGTAYR